MAYFAELSGRQEMTGRTVHVRISVGMRRNWRNTRGSTAVGDRGTAATGAAIGDVHCDTTAGAGLVMQVSTVDSKAGYDLSGCATV
jgi:hypothetical protein